MFLPVALPDQGLKALIQPLYNHPHLVGADAPYEHLPRTRNGRLLTEVAPSLVSRLLWEACPCSGCSGVGALCAALSDETRNANARIAVVDAVYNVEECQEPFGKGCWHQEEIILRPAHLAALAEGKILALDAREEYVVFVKLD